MKTWNPTEEQLVCRDLQHAWTSFTAERNGSEFERMLRCTRCRSYKIQRLDNEGYILNTTFVYSDGYLRPEGRLTRKDRAALRIRWF